MVGERDGRIVIRVTAPPVDGKANQALIRLIAKRAGIPPGSVELVRGQTARDKTIRIHGIEAAAARAALLSGG